VAAAGLLLVALFGIEIEAALDDAADDAVDCSSCSVVGGFNSRMPWLPLQLVVAAAVARGVLGV
jgi:hypothetical protein